jgi:hypothetical protein
METFKILVQLHIYQFLWNYLNSYVYIRLQTDIQTDIRVFTFRATLQGNIYSVIIRFLEPHFSSRLHTTWRKTSQSDNERCLTKKHVGFRNLRLGHALRWPYVYVADACPAAFFNLRNKSKTLLARSTFTSQTTVWGTASNSNTEILQRYQNKALRTTVNAPPYITNKRLHTVLKIRTFREEINKIQHQTHR